MSDQRVISSNPSKLIDESLVDFRVVHMTEVYRPSQSAAAHESYGLLSDETLAKEWAQELAGDPPCKTRTVLVLTDGKEAYPVGRKLIVINEEGLLAKARANFFAGLTAFQCRLLRIKPDGTEPSPPDDIPF